jgi:hypothetical protein
MSRDRHPAVTAAIGLAYLLAGLALLLQELGLPTPPWSLVVPLILLVIGSVLVVVATIGAHRARTAADTRRRVSHRPTEQETS